MPALQWKTIQLSFSAGLQTKGDPRVQNPPGLDVGRDIEFDDIGAARTRSPYALGSTMSWNVLGGGTLPATCRRVIPNGNELLVMTADTVYTWNAQLKVWCPVGTHLAVATTEATRCATMGDATDGDRAELANTVMFAWHEGVVLMIAAYDKATGGVLFPPTSLGFAQAPRLVALQTRILLFYQFTSTHQLRVLAIDPANVATSLGVAATNIGIINNTPAYDVAPIPGVDAAIFAADLNPTTSYLVGKVTAGVVVTTSTKARTSDGAIGVSIDPTGTDVQIIRASTVNVQGDLLLVSSLADVFSGQAIATVAATLGQVACAHRSVQNGGAYRCYVFISSGVGSSSTAQYTTQVNWVDTAGTIGTATNFVRQTAIGSRAFDRNGRIFVWLAFGATTGFSTSGTAGSSILDLQNNYFLYRDDAFLCAKAGAGVAGGVPDNLARPLPQVQDLGSGSFVWAGLQRRKIIVGPGTKGGLAGSGTAPFGSRAVREIAFIFDSRFARRAARLGATLYIAGGEPLQYDGVQLVEVGFHYAPPYFEMDPTTPVGSVEDGVYAYKPGWRWQNAGGEKERSINVAIGGVTMSGGPGTFDSPVRFPLFITHKTTVAEEIWRTTKNPTEDAPFYLVTDPNPLNTSNPNRYVANDTTVATLPDFKDAEADATASKNEEHPDNGGILTNFPPPPASIAIASDTRLFLAGVAGDPDGILYSKQRDESQVASFHPVLRTSVPSIGGDITALCIRRETLFAFRETAIYALPGDGFDNVGGGQNYGPARQLSQDVGAISQETVAQTPKGTLFKSRKGWYLLDDGQGVNYVGEGVAAFDGDTVLAIDVIESQHQVRVLTSARILIWDYLVGAWAEWTVGDGVDACVWQGQHVYLTASGPKIQQSSFSTANYGADIELAWLKPAELQGAARIARILILAEWRGVHKLRVRTAYDYESDGAGGWIYRDDYVFTPGSSVVGAIEQFRRGLSRQQCTAVKLRLTAIDDFSFATFTCATDFTTGGAPPVVGSTWNAVLQAQVFGVEGNGVTVSMYTESGIALEVRDHQRFDGASWVSAPYNLGIAIDPNVDDITFAMLEATITERSRLVKVLTPASTPGDDFGRNAVLHAGAFSGGETLPASGEAVKLVGLGADVGIRPSLTKRLGASQKG